MSCVTMPFFSHSLHCSLPATLNLFWPLQCGDVLSSWPLHTVLFPQEIISKVNLLFPLGSHSSLLRRHPHQPSRAAQISLTTIIRKPELALFISFCEAHSYEMQSRERKFLTSAMREFTGFL